MSKELLESLECPICTNIFVEPKQLGCGHTFCQTCANKLIKTAPARGHPNRLSLKIQCPKCRSDYKIPEGGLSTNFSIKDVVQALKDQENDEQNNTIACFHCAKKTLKVETFVCNSCNVAQPSSSHQMPPKDYMCCLCAFKLHNGHGIALCEDFATKEKREQAGSVIARCSHTANELIKGFRTSANTLRENLYGVFRDQTDLLKKNFEQFDALSLECFNVKATQMNVDLTHRVDQANALEQRIYGVTKSMDSLKEEIERKLYMHRIKTLEILGVVSRARNSPPPPHQTTSADEVTSASDPAAAPSVVSSSTTTRKRISSSPTFDFSQAKVVKSRSRLCPPALDVT